MLISAGAHFSYEIKNFEKKGGGVDEDKIFMVSDGGFSKYGVCVDKPGVSQNRKGRDT